MTEPTKKPYKLTDKEQDDLRKDAKKSVDVMKSISSSKKAPKKK
ncbi:MAG: hypothetical protein QM500_19885 [Methylococcales bacterium]